MVNKVFYMSFICPICTKDCHGQYEIIFVLLVLKKVKVVNTNRIYKRPYRPRLSLIRIGHLKELIDHDVLNTRMTYKRPY
jgi:hypothetical protein